MDLEIDKYCRLCLCQNDISADLFAKPSPSNHLMQQIETHLGITLTRESYWPSNVCEVCVELLNEIDQFKENVKRNQEKMKVMFPKEKRSKSTRSKSGGISTPAPAKSSKDESSFDDQHVSAVIDLDSDSEKGDYGEMISDFDLTMTDNSMSMNAKTNSRKLIWSDDEEEEKEKRKKTQNSNFEQASWFDCFEYERNLQFLRRFFCVTCGRQHEYDSLAKLQEHFKTVHNQDVMIECCQELHTGKEKIYTHSKWHMDLPSIKCPDCTSIFKNYDNTYEVHARFTHGKWFTCSTCFAKYSTNDQLAQHKNINKCVPPAPPAAKPAVTKKVNKPPVYHAAEQARAQLGKFRCLVCKKTFSSSYRRTLHYQEDHATVVCANGKNKQATVGEKTANQSKSKSTAPKETVTKNGKRDADTIGWESEVSPDASMDEIILEDNENAEIIYDEIIESDDLDDFIIEEIITEI